MFRKKLISKYTEHGFERQEAIFEIDFVFEIVAGISAKDTILGKSIDLKFEQEILQTVEERVKSKRPIQQIVGQAYFMGEKFFVNEYTLIPRPETEILILECLKLIPSFGEIKVLDIGTGTGCLPISVAKRTKNTKIMSVDICENALRVARKNAALFELENRIEFVNSDLFSSINQKFNIIMSNPPYIPITEKQNLQPEVRDFEPANALFAYDKNGIEFYKKIIEESNEYLFKGGYLIFELGINQSDLVQELMTKNGFTNTVIVKDLDGIDRVIAAQLI